MADTQHMTRITGVGRVMVPVTDQDQGIAFYVDKLGFEKRADLPYGNGERWVEVGAPGADTTIALVPERGAMSAGAMTGIILTTTDIDTTHTELGSRGVDVDAQIMRGDDSVPQMFWFRDQDANTLMVVG